MRHERTETHGLALWVAQLERADSGGRRDRVHLRFTGRATGPLPPIAGEPSEAPTAGAPGRPPRSRLLAALGIKEVAAAWMRQVHSARVLDGAEGACGEGDALVTERSKLALSVVTADCVPVLLAGTRPGDPVAAVHAGWRGIAQGVVVATVDRLTGRGVLPGRLCAWVGPAIGPCCYEVGPEVVDEVAAAVKAPRGSLIHPNPRPERTNPHLDLVAAVESQLRAMGVDKVHTVDACTHCREDLLWSYRREGPGGGRNVAFVWVERANRPRGSRA